MFFCHEGRKKVKGSYDNLSTCVAETAENSIKQAAHQKMDYRVIGVISSMDLRARAMSPAEWHMLGKTVGIITDKTMVLDEKNRERHIQ